MTLEKITPKVLLTRLKQYTGGYGEESQPVWLARHDKAWWLLSTSWAVRASVQTFAAIDNLWHYCNLEVEPMKFEADLAITRSDGHPPPPIAQLLEQERGERIEPRALGSNALVAETFDGDELVMWRRSDGSWATFRRDYQAFVLDFGEVGNWHQDSVTSPAVCFDPSGEPAALLLPVHDINGQLFRDPDLPAQLFAV